MINLAHDIDAEIIDASDWRAMFGSATFRERFDASMKRGPQ